MLSCELSSWFLRAHRTPVFELYLRRPPSTQRVSTLHCAGRAVLEDRAVCRVVLEATPFLYSAKSELRHE